MKRTFFTDRSKGPVYPVPGPHGGRLIRALIAGMRATGRLPLKDTSHIHIALSGGADSLALARLLVRYGRKIAPPSQLRILHIDHGWRPESGAQAKELGKLVREWGIPFQLIRAGARARPKAGESWEEAARAFRKEVFRKLTRQGQLVVTAHTADDLAETVLWRILTGTAKTHGGGILRDDDGILRPLLEVRKQELQAFVQEEGLKALEDQTNHDPKFMRARLRQELIPLIEAQFPRAVEHLSKMALEAQQASPTSSHPMTLAMGSVGVSARASHYRAVERVLAGQSGETRTIHLPGGWRLSGRGEKWQFEREKPRKSQGKARNKHSRAV